MTFIKRFYACLYDEKGDIIKFHKFNKSEKCFKYKNKTFNIMLNKSSNFYISSLFFKDTYYFYTINNPNPFKFDDNNKPVLDSEVYNALLETKVIKDVNEISKDNFFAKLLTPKNIIIGLIVIGVIIYLAQGGRIA